MEIKEKEIASKKKETILLKEATEVLLGQLQKLKAEKLECKMKKKEEKAKKKAARMDCQESESSSSSSSESECETVVSASQLKTIAAPPKEEALSSSLSSCLEGVVAVEENGGNAGGSVSIDGCSTKNKIEVCMGGKCKKSGAAMLMENFEKAVVGEGEAEAVVVGCKCMGKCRDGPNVRVVRDGPMVANPLSLCIGVGLEDVDSIVKSFIGGISSHPAPALSGV